VQLQRSGVDEQFVGTIESEVAQGDHLVRQEGNPLF